MLLSWALNSHSFLKICVKQNIRPNEEMMSTWALRTYLRTPVKEYDWCCDWYAAACCSRRSHGKAESAHQASVLGSSTRRWQEETILQGRSREDVPAEIPPRGYFPCKIRPTSKCFNLIPSVAFKDTWLQILPRYWSQEMVTRMTNSNCRWSGGRHSTPRTSPLDTQ